jgi:hypothetical protein
LKEVAIKYRRKIEELVEHERGGLGVVEPICFKDFCELFLANHFKEKSFKYKRTVTYQIGRFLPHCRIA